MTTFRFARSAAALQHGPSPTSSHSPPRRAPHGRAADRAAGPATYEPPRAARPHRRGCSGQWRGPARSRPAARRGSTERSVSERFAELWVRTIEARFAAIERLDAIDDQSFETARFDGQPHARRSIPTASLAPTVTGEDAHTRARHTSCSTELATQRLPRALDLARLSGTGAPEHPTIPDKSPARPLQRPAGMAHGKDTSACSPSLTPPPRAASPSPTATAQDPRREPAPGRR